MCVWLKEGSEAAALTNTSEGTKGKLKYYLVNWDRRPDSIQAFTPWPKLDLSREDAVWSLLRKTSGFILTWALVCQAIGNIMGLPRWLNGKESACDEEDIKDMGSIPGLGRSPGGGHGNPLQYSCLESPMDRGAWQATIHRVSKSQTRLKQLSTRLHARACARAHTHTHTHTHRQYQASVSNKVSRR